MNFELITFFLSAFIVAVSAYFDIRERRIPNFITLPSIIVGFGLYFVYWGWTGLKVSFIGLLIGGGCFLIFYAFGGIGAGDVKLMAGIGALLGMDKILTVILVTVFTGGIIALIIIMMKKIKGEYKILSSKNTFPYGLAIAIGTIITIWSHIK